LKNVWLHVVLALLAFLGIFIGILPDLFPDLASQYPRFKKMDKGFEELNNFKEIKSQGILFEKSELNQDDNGYEEVYNLLRSIDRSGTIKIFNTTPKSINIQKPQIYGLKDNRLKWGSKSLFVGVFMGGPGPICMMPELGFLMKEAKLRFFSRVGFGFAALAVILQFFYAIRGIKKSNSLGKNQSDDRKKNKSEKDII
jgi:hypothetical protein